MELAPRYCRSCGSRILVKNVCHNCNNDPLKGDNYCYDCGSLTPNADKCLRCGAKYKSKFLLKPVLITSGLLVIIIAIGGYFLSRPASTATNESNTKNLAVPAPQPKEIIAPDTIINTVKPIDTTATINPAQTPVAIDTPTAKPDSVKRNIIRSFSSQEVSSYGARCRYFIKNQRGTILFFVLGTSGFIRVNDKVSKLTAKSKGYDVSVYGNSEYQATLKIDGLTGSDKEWLASCTLIIKDISQNQTTRHKVYSTCIE